MTPIIKPFIFFLTLHFAIGKPTCQSGKIPQAIEIFYKDILPNPGTKGQNLTLIREAFADDFNVRPNFINPAKGLESGFFPEGVKQFMDIYSVIFSGIKVDRIITLVCGDKVVVLNKLRASINEAFPPGLTGKSLSEALIFGLTNPQYDNRLFIELQVQYMKIPSSEHGENMLCTEIVFDIQNNFCTQHVLPMFCKKKSF